MPTVWEAHMEPWIAELVRLHQPSPDTLAAMELVMHNAFVDTQGLVHVITGSLMGSGREEYSFVDGVWTGTITYGGPSPGNVNDPVEYAIYERARGGSHDFFQSMPWRIEVLNSVMFDHLHGR